MQIDRRSSAGLNVSANPAVQVPTSYTSLDGLAVVDDIEDGDVMAALSGVQLAQVLAQAGFTGETLVQMVAIATRESGGDPAAKNPNTSDRGLLQINGVNVPALVKAGIIKTQDDLFDPVKNAQAAWFLSKQGTNLSPWGYNPAAKSWAQGANPLAGTALNPARTAVNAAQSQGLLGKAFSGTGASAGAGQLDPRFASALNALVAASGGKVQIGEGYRSEASQLAEFQRRYAPGASGSANDRTYNGQKYHLKNPGDAPLASPGESMHSIGLAADLTGDLNWVAQHAAEYGLKTFKDVDNEPWHVQLASLPNGRAEYEKSSSYIPYGSADAGATTTAAAASTGGGYSKPQEAVFNAYLKSLPADQAQKIINDLKQPRTLGEVGAYMSQASPEVNQYIKYLGTLNAAGQEAEKNTLTASGTSSAADQGGPKLVPQQERDEFNKYLQTLPADQQTALIADLKKDRSLGDVGSWMTTQPAEVNRYVNYLGTLDAAGQYGEKSLLQAPDPAGSKQMTDLLSSLGVSYQNAPNPTPALLAFLKGIGLNMQTAADVKARALARIGSATADAQGNITRADVQTKKNITGQLVSRGVLSSGEANTRYSNHAADVAQQQSDVQNKATADTESTEDAYTQAQANARQAALDRVLGAEQDQAVSRATSSANVDATNAASQAADQSAAQQKAANDAALKAQQDEIARAAAQGTVV